MATKSNLTTEQRADVKDSRSARILVSMLNSKILSLESSLKKTQNAHERARKKLGKLESDNSVYKFMVGQSVWLELLKFIITAGLAGLAINMISSGNNNVWYGLGIFLVATLVYTIVTRLQIKRE